MAVRRSIAASAVLGAWLALAAPAVGHGPNAEIGDPAVVACLGEDLNGGIIGWQIDAGIQAGGGPKSIDVAPANCDHFWQTAEPDGGAGVIGNGNWPPPPYAG